MRNLGYFFYILILGIWTGGVFIFTFVVTPLIFKSYGRDKASDIVGNLFPSYFLFTIVIAFFALLFLAAAYPNFTKTIFRVSVSLAAMALCIAIYVKISLYPQIQYVKLSVPSFESSPVEYPARAEFRRLHVISSALNLVFLADGVALMAFGTLLRK